jgi:peroxiredoxin
MNAYRDQYAQVFNNGKGVTILAISADPDTTQAGWAKEAGYPVTFISDTARALGPLYNTLPAPRAGSTARPLYSRVLFIVGKDGKIAHVMRPFRELVQDSYDELEKAVATAMKQ